MAHAYLCNGPNPIIDVEIEKGNVVTINEVIKENEHLLPILFQGDRDITLKELNDWLDKRKIPERREGIKESRLLFPNFENYHHMLSLSDQYWFQYRKKEKWEKLNFFDNSYPQEKGLLFFEPWKVDPKNIQYETPDATTGGVLRKRWIQDENKNSYLIKARSKAYHQAPLSEVLASITLKKLNIIPFVEYEMLIYGLCCCSKCANFVTSHTEFVPAAHIYLLKENPDKARTYEHFYQMCQDYGIVGAREYIANMTAIDHILCNTDRHLYNFGFIRNIDNGKIIGFAPLFDFGHTYWGSANAEHSSKLFGDIESDAFKKVIKKIDVDLLIDSEDMENLIRQYPEISQQQSNMIIKKIHKINRQIIEIKPPRKMPDYLR